MARRLAPAQPFRFLNVSSSRSRANGKGKGKGNDEDEEEDNREGERKSEGGTGGDKTTAKKKKTRKKKRARRLEGGFSVGGCPYSAPGTGIVSLGPRKSSAASGTLSLAGAIEAGGGGREGLVAVVAGTTRGGFDKALELFRSDLFVTNRWQHRLPDYIVAGPRYEAGRHAHRTLQGVAAAGYWGNRWEHRSDASFPGGACGRSGGGS